MSWISLTKVSFGAFLACLSPILPSQLSSLENNTYSWLLGGKMELVGLAFFQENQHDFIFLVFPWKIKTTINLQFNSVANLFLLKHKFQICFILSFIFSSRLLYAYLIWLILNKFAPWLGLCEHIASLHVESLNGRIVHLLVQKIIIL